MADSEKCHKCAFCERQFAKVEHLKRHERSHTGEKPFKCPKCNQRYARSDVLARHIQNHPTRGYRSKITKRIASPRTGQQPVLISADDARPDQESPRARNATTLTTIDDQDNVEGPQDNISRRGNPPVGAIDQHRSTSNAVSPLPEWLLAPIQSVNGMEQQLFAPQQMEVPNVQRRLEIQDSLNYDSPSFIHRAPLLDLPIVDSWPLLTTLRPGYDPSDFNLGIVFNGASMSFENTGQLVDGSPRPSSLHMPTVNSNNTPKATETTQHELPGPDSLNRIQQMWCGKGPSQPALLVRTLWNDIAEHSAANILSDIEEHVNLFPTPSPEQGSESRMESQITAQCRDRLFTYYRRTQGNQGRTSASNMLSPREGQPEGISSDPPSRPDLPDLQFPSVETLDLSLKFYFRHVHQSLPFVHRPTFHASTTPCLLLLPMILIGYSILDPYGSERFVSCYRTSLIELCRADLACKARGKLGSPSGLIRSLASSLLVLYLNLECQDRDEDASLMLCAQALHIAEKHGLYETNHCQELIDCLLMKYSDGESGWKLWARIESVKRLILCLIRMDSAYARLLGTNGVIDPSQVKIVLPANSVLFDSPTVEKFVDDAKVTAAVAIPLIRVRHLAESAPASELMNEFLLRVILDHIHISVSSAQVKILSAADDDMLQISGFAPVNLYNRTAEAKDISHHLVTIWRNYARFFQPPADPLCALSWNYLCMIMGAPVELLELALGRRGPQCAPKAHAAIETWSKSSAARRAALHAAQIFYILSSGVYLPLSPVENKLLRVESMVFTSALVLGLYLFTQGTRMSSSTLVGNGNTPAVLELLQEIDWTTINGEGFADEEHDWMVPFDNSGPSSSQFAGGVQVRQFIRHGELSLSFDGESQLQGAKTARRIFQEYAYLLDQLCGSRRSGSDLAKLARSVSDVLGSFEIGS